MGLLKEDVNRILDLYEWKTGFFCVDCEEKKPVGLWSILGTSHGALPHAINITDPVISTQRVDSNALTFKVNVGIQVVRPANYITLNITT